jgi:hypothetical protein
MLIVTLRLETLDLQGQHLKRISWPSMWSLDGTGHQNYSSIVPSTLQQLIYGQWVVYLVKSWLGNLYFLGKTMFISWGLLQRYVILQLSISRVLEYSCCVFSIKVFAHCLRTEALTLFIHLYVIVSGHW